MIRQLLFASLSMMLGLVLAGCSGGGEAGAERIELSGAVTFEGKPVPYGQITFTPDATKGGTGPGGTATIENGRYQTVPDKGPTAGPHVAVITGYSSQEPEQPGGAPPLLFADRRVEVAVSADQKTLDLEVPRQ